MQNSQIFNPMSSVGDSGADTQHEVTAGDKDHVATAAIYNEKLGECPKCKGKMISAVIANSDSVFFCEKCRVSTPMADG